MKVAILYNTTDYLLRFRTELIVALQKIGCEVIAITPSDAATPQLKYLNVRWCEWNLSGQSLNPIKDFLSILRLLRILQSESPDVVLNFTIKPVLYGSLIASFLNCPRIVSMITGMGSVFQEGGIKKRILLLCARAGYRAAMHRNHKVLFQNEEDQAYFLKNRFLTSDKTVRINGSGVNLELFTPQPDTSIVPGSFLLISRMIKEKGIYEFVTAARRIKDRFPKSKFILVGPIDKNPGAISRYEIAEWEQEGVLCYAGVHSDVRSLIAQSEVFVLPSYYLEGIPRTILEALSMGKPIITSDWRGCRDTVVPGKNGFLVSPQNPLELEKAMLHFLENPQLSTQFGAESRRLAEEKFNVFDINTKVIATLGIENNHRM